MMLAGPTSPRRQPSAPPGRAAPDHGPFWSPRTRAGRGLASLWRRPIAPDGAPCRVAPRRSD